jgi:c(7)-type cytochrome triheme protein
MMAGGNPRRPSRDAGQRHFEEDAVRPTTVWALLLVSIVALWFLAVPPAQPQIKVPPDFAVEQGKDSPGTVTFSHEQHKAKVEGCQSCHVKVFKMKKGTTGTLTMEKMKAGEQCGACHNGKTQIAGKAVFTVDDKANCERCHKKN